MALGQHSPGGVGKRNSQHPSIRERQLHREADELRERRGHPRIHHAFDLEETRHGQTVRRQSLMACQDVAHLGHGVAPVPQLSDPAVVLDDVHRRRSGLAA